MQITATLRERFVFVNKEDLEGVLFRTICTSAEYGSILLLISQNSFFLDVGYTVNVS